MIAPDLQSLARPIKKLKALPGNPRRGDVEAVMRSYERFGQRKPIVALRDGTVIAGNHQLQAARRLGWREIAVVYVDDDDQTARAYALADNRVADLGTYDDADLAALLRSVETLDGTGYTPADLSSLLRSIETSETRDESVSRVDPPSLADRFVVPPFTVLDGRAGSWQERKRRWLSLGIRSEEGRGSGSEDDALTLPSLSGRVPDYYAQKEEAERRLGHVLSREEFESKYLVVGDTATLSTTGTSIFDPVLCELVYRWWSPPSGQILDPFAGGSVRGVVAALLDRQYTGIDLRGEQVTANGQQWREVSTSLTGSYPAPRWIEGDSTQINTLLDADSKYDLLFTCPPYADLEVYSDNPADISTMPYPAFIEVYREIIALAAARLRDDRFAAIVVGDIRDRKGSYRNFVGDTVQAFLDAGLSYYNEAVLVTPIGSLAVRTPRQFSAGRKLGKTHQNLLVFVKGSGKRAAQACGQISVEMPEDLTLRADDVQSERSP